MSQATFNLLMVILVAILAGGLLFYLNIITGILKKCCQNTSGSGDCSISYPENSIGAAITNLLSYSDGATVSLGPEGVFPLRADLTGMNCTVRVVIKSTNPDFQISSFPNQHKWFVRGVGEQEWQYFSYGPGVADGNVNLQGTGEGTIEVYENGEGSPVKTITVQL